MPSRLTPGNAAFRVLSAARWEKEQPRPPFARQLEEAGEEVIAKVELELDRDRFPAGLDVPSGPRGQGSRGKRPSIRHSRALVLQALA